MAERKEKLDGEVIEALRFRIRLDNRPETLGYTAVKMKRYRTRF